MMSEKNPNDKTCRCLNRYMWSIWPATDGHWRAVDDVLRDGHSGPAYYEFNTAEEALAWIHGRIIEDRCIVPRLRSFFEYQRSLDPNFRFPSERKSDEELMEIKRLAGQYADFMEFMKTKIENGVDVDTIQKLYPVITQVVITELMNLLFIYKVKPSWYCAYDAQADFRGNEALTEVLFNLAYKIITASKGAK